MRLVHGVGINDAEYPVSAYASIEGKSRRTWLCPFYNRWAKMLSRCYSEKMQKHSPTYAGCTVVEEWNKFSTFKAWMEEQDWEGMELDKDILVAGNKVYSPATCAFVPKALNTVLLDCRSARGEYPLGVDKGKKASPTSKCYKAQGRIKGKQVHLGRYFTPEEAHAAWQRSKIQAIKDVFADWKNPDPRVGPAIDRIVAKLQSDLDNGRETISFLE